MASKLFRRICRSKSDVPLISRLSPSPGFADGRLFVPDLSESDLIRPLSAERILQRRSGAEFFERRPHPPWVSRLSPSADLLDVNNDFTSHPDLSESDLIRRLSAERILQRRSGAEFFERRSHPQWVSRLSPSPDQLDVNNDFTSHQFDALSERPAVHLQTIPDLDLVVHSDYRSMVADLLNVDSDRSQFAEFSPSTYLQSQCFSGFPAYYRRQRGTYLLVLQCASSWLLSQLHAYPFFKILRPFYTNDMIIHCLRHAYLSDEPYKAEEEKTPFDVEDFISLLAKDGGPSLSELQYFWPNLCRNDFLGDVYQWRYAFAKHNKNLYLLKRDYFQLGMNLYYDFMNRFEYPKGGVPHPDGLGLIFSPQQISDALPFNGIVVLKDPICGLPVLDSILVRYEKDLSPVPGFIVFNLDIKVGRKQGVRVENAPAEILWPGPLLFT